MDYPPPDSFAGLNFLHTDNVAPVLIGELGTIYETQSDQQWLKKLIDYIQQNELNWTYWCWNPNSGDTGGILSEDWISVHEEKQALLATMQYPLIGSGAPQPDPDPGPDPDSNPDQPPNPDPDTDEDSDSIGCMISTMIGLP